MTAPRPPVSSLDALLQSTREQFERTFADRQRQADAAGLRRGPPAAVAVATAGAPAPAAPDIDATLDRRFGADWSAELVETRTVGGTLSALYRLTADGRSALEFGDAPAGDGGEEARQAALEEARQTALAKAADTLAHGARPSAPAERTLPRAPAAAPRAAPASSGALAALALDRIEAAWRQIRKEAGIVLAHHALAPSVRHRQAEAASLTDAGGAALIGRPVPAVAALVRAQAGDLRPGDIFLLGDPWAPGGGLPAGTWTAVAPAFGPDSGGGGDGGPGGPAGFGTATMAMGDHGPVGGSRPNRAASAHDEGLRIPPMRIFGAGGTNRAALELILNNVRDPDAAHGDLRALVAAARTGAQGIADLCRRFGADGYRQACAATLARSERALRGLIAAQLPEEPKSFEDRVDSDGCGNGPFALKLTIWREGDLAFCDWTGTAAQAEGPINLPLDDAAVAHIVAQRLVRIFDPEIAVNDGLLAPFRIAIPDGSLLRPHFPAPLGNGAHTLARVHDVVNGALGLCAEAAGTAAGYGSSPQMVFAGRDRHGRPFRLTDPVFGGAPARPGRDGQDGRSLSAGARTRPVEQVEAGFPVAVESLSAIADSGGGGRQRGGCGVEKVYRFAAAGTVRWRDDRERSRPWGGEGGEAGAASAKILIRADGSREEPGAKADGIGVAAGDRLVFRTAGGGGWGNPLERDPQRVCNDVRRGLVSTAAARDRYGVVLTGRPEACTVDRAATDELRDTLGRSRGRAPSSRAGRGRGE